jgi:hypothetical protein
VRGDMGGTYARCEGDCSGRTRQNTAVQYRTCHMFGDGGEGLTDICECGDHGTPSARPACGVVPGSMCSTTMVSLLTNINAVTTGTSSIRPTQRSMTNKIASMPNNATG